MTFTDEQIAEFIYALKLVTNHNFQPYSEKSFRRRIEKILTDRNITIQQLQRQCTESIEFSQKIVKEITVNTTEFFRDTNTWVELSNYVERHFSDKAHINVWSAGCSNGLEVYSLIVLFNELGLLHKTSIYGTDLNVDMLERARSGKYTFRVREEFFENFSKVWQNSVRTNPEEFYFDVRMRDNIAQIRPQFLTKPVLLPHNLTTLTNPIGQQFDLILCRNVLIYFNHQMQDQVLYFFHAQLAKRGTLVLGVHEGMLGSVTDKYIKTGQIYIAR